MTLNRVVITTGGTGGHIFPALAVATELVLRNKGVDVLFVGGPGPEGDMARKFGLRFVELPASGIMGRGIPGILSAIGWVGTAVPRAIATIWRFKPEVVIGFGGYAGFCPVLAAWMLGKPTAVHEQNSVPGVTNKVLGNLVKRIFLSFRDNTVAFPVSKTTLTGNPVRLDIFKAAERRQSRITGKRVLVLGGSQGAKPINDAIIEGLPKLMEAGVTLVHQAGKADYTRVRAAYEAAGADSAQVHEFIEDMGTEYASCDLAICRSGATTVFEIAAAGVPAIFVPFPHATHDHQTMNATAMSDLGAAKLIPQSVLTGDMLAHAACRLLDDEKRLKDMEEAARQFAKPNAAADIVSGLESLVTQGRGV
ncbi:undecaprenyldiphospho-muramoylpentapeptide beta-N-acetylglucosaminyltransferase [Pseudodesulfovibrio sediminis]|uniref:UDP-N-acetylglucosamine--N-acetylmuramyl-(pentapeptide) pyrophosphoryl-undecaprenol N-acetylglucosamine transferase n=1 Tax=Pseudodesulfovibrio sediminis TaxID=2810563 RepID=A0ABN6ESZ4_9BACT|nr:undecaprenyldiphospho-muramoylpentapeptide beta-N-acetylglucosaminyltransferase [Pseudodesulfovibrio sediminis]BCS88354.1 UDP-N-acetylglucosamine--N-acetylmuramyl-(pentapeptide) pyrophosphoryl-undecaprenol N-acetylglucosamine transferase [Pseudodesulfovibrio sediminis]